MRAPKTDCPETPVDCLLQCHSCGPNQGGMAQDCVLSFRVLAEPDLLHGRHWSELRVLLEHLSDSLELAVLFVSFYILTAPRAVCHGLSSTVSSALMASLKSEDLEDAKPPITPPPQAQNELEYWKTLAFTFFDSMDHHKSGSSRTHGSRMNAAPGPNSVSGSGQSGDVNRDAALLAQFAAANTGMAVDPGFPQGLPPVGYPSLGPTPGFYGNFFHHDSMGPPANQLPPMANMDFPWPHMSPPPQQYGSLPYHHPQSSMSPGGSSPTTSTFVPSPYPIPPPPPQMQASSSRGSRGRSVSSAGEELTEAERAAIAEEKRRRNTAASSRFRIKKKQKTVNLERTVSDLTGRAEDLEKEVADLRRENGWLKEIVMLKGTRIASSSMAHRMALNQAAAMVGQEGASTSQLPDESSSGQNDESEDESDSSDDDTVAKAKSKADSSARRK